MSAVPPLALPPQPHTRDGAWRRVGVELEMSGLDIGTLARLVANHVRGDVEALSRYEHHVHGDVAGTWHVELDFAYLKQRGREKRSGGDGVLAQIDDVAEELLAVGSQALVPLEVVTPPLPLNRLVELESLIARLRSAGARGTHDALTYAFGMHLNPELPDTDALTVTRYLKAFLCLFEWLRARERVDLLRRLTVYIDPFPPDYVRHVVSVDYWPSVETLIDDYLELNPTRNRALDMLPLFAHLDAPRVRRQVDDPRIKPRPTLHYRLPNCEIDEPGWGLRRSWNDWLQVEHLAADPARLDQVCAHYSEFLERPLARLVDDWAEELRPWLLPAVGL